MILPLFHVFDEKGNNLKDPMRCQKSDEWKNEMDNPRKLYVSIIDNDQVIQNMLVKILNMMSIDRFEVEIKTYNDGIEFFESDILNQRGEHLLMLDGVMPVMDGIEILHRVKQDSSKHVYVLMLSGRKSHKEIEKALKIGADDYVTKPFSIKELQARVLQLIQRM